jgi:hypothetical protein
VAVRKRDGQLAYEDVYAFGHKDAMAVADFVQLTLNPVGTNASGIYIESRVLELSASHFAPLVLAGTGRLLMETVTCSMAPKSQ